MIGVDRLDYSKCWHREWTRSDASSRSIPNWRQQGHLSPDHSEEPLEIGEYAGMEPRSSKPPADQRRIGAMSAWTPSLMSTLPTAARIGGALSCGTGSVFVPPLLRRHEPRLQGNISRPRMPKIPACLVLSALAERQRKCRRDPGQSL